MLANPVLLEVLLCSSGLGALRLGWRRPGAGSTLSVVVGWLLLAVAIYVAVSYWGVEFGISYALAGISVLALVLVGLNCETRPAKREKPVSNPDATPSLHKWLTCLSAGPLAGIASCQVTLMAVYFLPGSEINRMAAAAVLFPVLWGIAAYISCLIGRPGRQALALSLVTIATSLILYIPEA